MKANHRRVYGFDFENYKEMYGPSDTEFGGIINACRVTLRNIMNKPDEPVKAKYADKFLNFLSQYKGFGNTLSDIFYHLNLLNQRVEEDILGGVKRKYTQNIINSIGEEVMSEDSAELNKRVQKYAFDNITNQESRITEKNEEILKLKDREQDLKLQNLNLLNKLDYNDKMHILYKQQNEKEHQTMKNEAVSKIELEQFKIEIKDFINETLDNEISEISEMIKSTSPKTSGLSGLLRTVEENPSLATGALDLFNNALNMLREKLSQKNDPQPQPMPSYPAGFPNQQNYDRQAELKAMFEKQQAMAAGYSADKTAPEADTKIDSNNE
ncbi:MAG: hypothetical protein WCT77_00660 [Bacteroidota bacterium]